MKATTKRKTSVTLSPEVVKTIDRLAGAGGNRSAVIEQAVLAFWEAQMKSKRDTLDRKILDANVERLNEEADDVLKYQVEL
jgi:Arc/MetJ-type ribon-helix-helix transcriptional regulator